MNVFHPRGAVIEGAALLNHSEGYCLKYLQSTVPWLLQLKKGEGGWRKKNERGSWETL